MAQVLTRRAIDLAAISLVLIVGLTAGREIITWWQADTSPVDPTSTDPQTEWSNRPVDIQFGDTASYSRVPFQGTADAAIAELVRQLSKRIPSADSLPPATGDEQAWIEKFSELTPTETTAAGASIYVVPAMLPTAAVTISVNKRDHLVGWAMALPADDEAWTLLVFSPTKHGSTSPLAEIRLPANATTLFGWTDDGGAGVRAFHGPGRVADWLAHFDAEFGPRSDASDAGRARWLHDGRQIDLQFSQNGDEITALLWMTTASSRQNTTP